jgi:tetratricopeptide (TPR) repeat protein
MLEEHEQLHRIFVDFYRINPAVWPPPVLEMFTGPYGNSEALGVDEFSGDDSHLRPQDLPPLPTADQYFARGWDYLRGGLFELAAADFDSVLRLEPNDQEALACRARARLGIGNSEAALVDAQLALEADPEDLNARLVRGMALVEQHQAAAALADLTTVLKNRKETPNVEALYYRGLAYVALGKHRRAIADFSDAIRYAPNDADAFRQRARAHQHLGNSPAAQQDLARAKELDEEAAG